MINISQMIIVYVLLVLIVICTYFYTSEKFIIKDIIAILSGLTIALGLLNYINIAIQNDIKKDKENKQNYIDNISSIFIKINSLYLQYPNELHNLFYEFYGYNNFPLSNESLENTPTPSTSPTSSPTKSHEINSIEFMCINLIIEYLNNMYIVNPLILSDLNIRNRITCFTQSNKFKTILASIKDNYSPDFFEALNTEKIILHKELNNQNINIPYL